MLCTKLANVAAQKKGGNGVNKQKQTITPVRCEKRERKPLYVSPLTLFRVCGGKERRHSLTWLHLCIFLSFLSPPLTHSLANMQRKEKRIFHFPGFCLSPLSQTEKTGGNSIIIASSIASGKKGTNELISSSFCFRRTYKERLTCQSECFSAFEQVSPHHRVAQACIHAACSSR